MNDSRRFTIIALIWGLLMSFIIIPWQTPDEHTHLSMMSEELHNPYIAQALSDDMPLGLNRIEKYYDQKVDYNELKVAMAKRPSYTALSCMPGGLSITIVKHLPAAIGILLGIILHFPTYWVLQMGELFSLVFYVIVCTKALNLMPCKKIGFEAVMLLPMCMQQGASINYDAVLLPLCFLFVAYVLNIKFTSKLMDIKNVLILLIILFCIALIKIPYISLGILLFLIPIDKYCIRFGKYEFDGKKYLGKGCFWGLGIVLLGILGIFFLKDNKYIKIILITLQDIEATKALLDSTAVQFGESIFKEFVGVFGWADSSMPDWFIYGMPAIMLVLFMTCISDENAMQAVRVGFFDKAICLVCYVVMNYLVSISMIAWTVDFFYGQGQSDLGVDIYMIPFIAGLQGRYFIPSVIPFMLIFPDIFKMGKKESKLVLTLIYVIGVMCTFVVLKNRYW